MTRPRPQTSSDLLSGRVSLFGKSLEVTQDPDTGRETRPGTRSDTSKRPVLRLRREDFCFPLQPPARSFSLPSTHPPTSRGEEVRVPGPFDPDSPWSYRPSGKFPLKRRAEHLMRPGGRPAGHSVTGTCGRPFPLSLRSRHRQSLRGPVSHTTRHRGRCRRT